MTRYAVSVDAVTACGARTRDVAGELSGVRVGPALDGLAGAMPGSGVPAAGATLGAGLDRRLTALQGRAAALGSSLGAAADDYDRCEGSVAASVGGGER